MLLDDFELVIEFRLASFELPVTLLVALRPLSFTFADIHQQRSH